MKTPGIVNIDGRLTVPEKATVSVFDRSYLYGDGIYEVVRTYKGQTFGLEEHLDRLEGSAQLSRLPMSHTREFFKSQMLRTVAAFQRLFPGVEAYCRLIVSRGKGRIGFPQEFVGNESNPFTIIVLPVEGFGPVNPGKGPWDPKHLWVVERLRISKEALTPAIKSGNYLNNILACLEAREQGADDGIMLNSEGHLTEGTTFNIFWFSDGELFTPHLGTGILSGITRHHLLQLAKSTGLKTHEVHAEKAKILSADECFLTSSTKEIVPVNQINGQVIGTGDVGPLTEKIAADFHEWLLGRLDPATNFSLEELTVYGTSPESEITP